MTSFDPIASLQLVRAVAASETGVAACAAFVRHAVDGWGAPSASVWVDGDGGPNLAASAGAKTPALPTQVDGLWLDLTFAGRSIGRAHVALAHRAGDSERATWEAATAVLAARLDGDRERAQRQLVEAERDSLARIFDDMPAAAAVHRGPDLVYERVSRAYRDASDGRPMLGRTYADAFPEFVEQGHKAALDAIFQTGAPFSAGGVRADTPRRPGEPPEERYWNVEWRPTRDGAGHVDGVVTFAFEVTDEVVARQVAESARQHFDDLVRSVDALAWKADPETWRVLWVSGPVERVLGCRLDEASEPARWWAPIHPDDRDAVANARRSARTGGSYDVEFRVTDQGTGWRWLAETGRFGGDGTPAPYIWGLTVDITGRRALQSERERVQAQLLHLQKIDSLGLLAGGIAHDFNNLLTAILGNASLASAAVPADHPGSSPIRAMVSAAQRASELTGQLLAYTGRGHFRVQHIDVNTRIRELTALLGASLAKTAQLRLTLAPTLPPVEADVAQLQQVLMNLVINGADAIGAEGGTVLIATGVQDVDADYARSFPGFSDVKVGRYVYIEVSDTGAGMSAETVSRIFDPFFTTKADGRGLGLAAVQGIVRGHGGMIHVYSEIGRGTTFKVLLPAADPSDEDAAPPPTASAPPMAGTVLIVDDEPAVREVARSMLEHCGYTVMEASGGHEAVHMFRANATDVDLVLLDLTMPRMSGEEVFRELRRIRPDTLVLLSSGYNEVEATRRMIGRGHAGFIQKPYTLDQLTAAVQAAMVRPR